MLGRHGVRRLPGGRLRVTIGGAERDALRALPPQLRPVLDGDEHPQARQIRARLFPPAADDADTERAYRDLVGDDLANERIDLLDRFEASLARGRAAGGSWSIELDADDAHAWLTVVNDTRLTLGTVLGITSEGQWERGPDPEEPRSFLLYWLGWLEEELVQALTRGLG